MTQAQLTSIKNQTISLPILFASGASADLKEIPKTTNDNSVSLQNGYSASYENAAGSPKAIERKKINWLFRALSQASYHSVIGVRYTYNAEFAEAIGGYPQYAILSHDVGTSIRYVISLQNNNTKNFLTDGVDGTYWKYIDTFDGADLYPDYGTCSYILSTSIPPLQSNVAQAGSWVAMPKDGWIYPQFDIYQGATTYLVLGPANGDTPTVSLSSSGDISADMVPDSTNSKNYTVFLLGNNTYQNKVLLPVKKGTKIGVFGKNVATSPLLDTIGIGVIIRMYGGSK